MSKDIDAVEMVRQIRDGIYEQTKEMSAAELVEFFRRHGSSARDVISHPGEAATNGQKGVLNRIDT